MSGALHRGTVLMSVGAGLGAAMTAGAYAKAAGASNQDAATLAIDVGSRTTLLMGSALLLRRAPATSLLFAVSATVGVPDYSATFRPRP